MRKADFVEPTLRGNKTFRGLESKLASRETRKSLAGAMRTLRERATERALHPSPHSRMPERARFTTEAKRQNYGATLTSNS